MSEPRHVKLNQARVELMGAVQHMRERHDLTPTEVLHLLAEELRSRLLSPLKAERDEGEGEG